MTEKQRKVIVVGAGLSGLSVAHFITKRNPDADILILEKQAVPGGAVKSYEEGGYLAEWGPHGFLDNVAESREALDDLRLSQDALKAPLRRFMRYICLNGKLAIVPQTPPKIISSKLLPPTKKIRILADLWKKPRLEEQTVADWAAYRFGKAALPFADIILTGSYAGDMHKLSIDAAMPGLRRLEVQAGSVIRGAIRSRKQNKGTGIPSMVSFKSGMTTLIQKLAANRSIVYGAEIQSISRQENGWLVAAKDAQYVAQKLVIALHINQALKLLNPLLAAPADSVPEARIHNIVVGFDDQARIPPGFGYLAPRDERRFALGAMFSSNMFPNRAPRGMQLLEILIGGTRNPEHLEMDDAELIEKSYQDVSQLMELPQEPAFKRVLRAQAGIPQLEIGHVRFQDYRDRLESDFPGLFICGFGWEGIGVNEMIKDAKTTALGLAADETAKQRRAEIKGVYV